MSGLSEIIQWTDNEIDLELFDNTPDAFDAINAIFVGDNRSDLDSILLDQKSDYLAFLRSRIEEIPEETIEEQIETAMRALFG